MKKLMDREFLTLFKIKRFQASEDVHLLLIPENDDEKEVQKYLCLKFSHEEKILNEVLDIFKDAQYYNESLKKRVTQQVYFKLALDAFELKVD